MREHCIAWSKNHVMYQKYKFSIKLRSSVKPNSEKQLYNMSIRSFHQFSCPTVLFLLLQHTLIHGEHCSWNGRSFNAADTTNVRRKQRNSLYVWPILLRAKRRRRRKKKTDNLSFYNAFTAARYLQMYLAQSLSCAVYYRFIIKQESLEINTLIPNRTSAYIYLSFKFSLMFRSKSFSIHF